MKKPDSFCVMKDKKPVLEIEVGEVGGDYTWIIQTTEYNEYRFNDKAAAVLSYGDMVRLSLFLQEQLLKSK